MFIRKSEEGAAFPHGCWHLQLINHDNPNTYSAMLKSHFINLYLDSPFSFITIGGSNKITEIALPKKSCTSPKVEQHSKVSDACGRRHINITYNITQ